ncbi:acetyl-CoA synthetase-like protein [Xylaria sp. FL1777]|nr:acetyl-CoA synthetase-like protein [Xylaria sp. FL1777]
MAPTSSSEDQGPLLPAVIDELARNDPKRPWASIPIDDGDLSRGYEDISCEALANAINKLAWLIDSTVGQSTTGETIAYLGSSDLRYHMIQMAACKTGYQVLFSSHLNSLHVHLSLMEQLDCRSLFYSEGTQVDDILASRPLKSILVPDLDDLLDVNDRAKWYPYTKTYEEAALDSYAVLHTSGTTGDPKPLIFNHAIIKSLYMQNSLPDVEGRSHISIINNPGFHTRVLLPTSPFHVISSLCGLYLSVIRGGVLVMPYRNRGMSVNDPILDVFKYSNTKVAIMMPHYMDAVARRPNPGDYIQNFEKIYFGGGDLTPLTRSTWAKYTRIYNSWGSSELGFTPQLESDPEDHEYVYFDLEHSGLEFREVKIDDNIDGVDPVKLYEMVLTWTPETAKYSAHYARQSATIGSGPPYPEFHVGDLWTPHPDLKKSRYAWRFAGRMDDLITLAAGINLRTGGIEQALLAHSQVKAAIVLGNKRLQPLVVLELAPGTPVEAVHEIWKSVLEPLNAKAQSHARIASTHMLVVPADGLLRTPKGTISKKKSERKFSKEIEEIYQRFGDVWQDKGLPSGDKA